MTQDEIAQIMQDTAGNAWGTESHFQRFAKLVAAAEREACAKVCDDIDVEYEGEDILATWCSRAIRARGEA